MITRSEPLKPLSHKGRGAYVTGCGFDLCQFERSDAPLLPLWAEERTSLHQALFRRKT